MSDDYTKIIVLENEIEAQVMASVLEERGIPHRMRTYRDLAYDGLFQFQKGWGHIEAPEQYRKDIESLCEEVRKNR